MIVRIDVFFGYSSWEYYLNELEQYIAIFWRWSYCWEGLVEPTTSILVKLGYLLLFLWMLAQFTMTWWLNVQALYLCYIAIFVPLETRSLFVPSSETSIWRSVSSFQSYSGTVQLCTYILWFQCPCKQHSNQVMDEYQVVVLKYLLAR